MIERLVAEHAELKAEASQPLKTPGNSSVQPLVGFMPIRAARRGRARHRLAHLALADPRGRRWIIAIVSPGRVVKVKHEVTVI